MRRQGFTLLEISIVIAIIGLILGSVAIGKEMIRNAQIQGLNKDFGHYVNAIKMFQEKYGALPGDFARASIYLRIPLITSGNGDGLIVGNEEFLAWQHLAVAGFIEGNYPGFSSGGNIRHPFDNADGPKNVPSTQLNGAGWGLLYYDTTSDNLLLYTAGEPLPGHVLWIGGTTFAGSEETMPILTTEEAELLDIKLDDGMPGTGKILSQVNALTTTSCHSSASAYNVTAQGLLCSLAFKTGF
jgi:prepilin-type N-terminal cleavage/methylation domain-containing protein